jgi:hypothetical protein
MKRKVVYYKKCKYSVSFRISEVTKNKDTQSNHKEEIEVWKVLVNQIRNNVKLMEIKRFKSEQKSHEF